MKDKYTNTLYMQVGSDNHNCLLFTRFDEVDNEFALYGFSILKNKRKYLNKKKLRNYEHILFRKDDLKNLADKILKVTEDKDEYISCSCKAEILRIMKFDSFVYLEIFDNYFLDCPKGIETDISLDEKAAKEFTDFLYSISNTTKE